MGNYIKINRSILDWEWWNDINTCRLFIFLLLKANWKDGTWKGVEVKRGSYISTLEKLAYDTNLTKDETRTALKHLKKTKEITTQSTRKYTVFTVRNYDKYQNDTTLNPTQTPNKSHTIPTLIPHIEEYKYSKIKKETPNGVKKKFEPPSVDDVRAYCNERGNSVDPQTFIDFYTANGWVQGKGKPIRDWKAAVRTWERNQINNKQGSSPKKRNQFNSFPQRERSPAEMGELEKRLLGGKG